MDTKGSTQTLADQMLSLLSPETRQRVLAEADKPKPEYTRWFIENDCPALPPLLDSGLAKIESAGEVVGLASDGQWVSLGSVWSRRDRLDLASYLRSHPAPEDW